MRKHMWKAIATANLSVTKHSGREKHGADREVPTRILT
jgi:hypothetical protein